LPQEHGPVPPAEAPATKGFIDKIKGWWSKQRFSFVGCAGGGGGGPLTAEGVHLTALEQVINAGDASAGGSGFGALGGGGMLGSDSGGNVGLGDMGAGRGQQKG